MGQKYAFLPAFHASLHRLQNNMQNFLVVDWQLRIKRYQMFTELPSAISNYSNKPLLYLQLTRYLIVQAFCSGGRLSVSATTCTAFCAHPQALHRFEVESLLAWGEGGKNKPHPLTAIFGNNSISLFMIFLAPNLRVEEPFNRKEWCWPRSFRDGLGRILLLQNPSQALLFPHFSPCFLENHFTSLQRHRISVIHDLLWDFF